MTVHNRKDLTLSCLERLYAQVWHGQAPVVSVFLTDDGCTDGTPEAVKTGFPDVCVIPGDGELYWNRGMYSAWMEASKYEFDYYLWLNDDTMITHDCVSRLLDSSMCHHDEVVVVGSTCKPGDASVITYGGWLNGKLITDVSKEAECSTMNGNIVLVPRKVFSLVGLNDPYYHHALGDMDYGYRTIESGCKICLASGIFGECAGHERMPIWMDPEASLKNRLNHFFKPTGNNPFEYFHFRRVHFGFPAACLTFVSNFIHLLFPRLWK